MPAISSQKTVEERTRYVLSEIFADCSLDVDPYGDDQIKLGNYLIFVAALTARESVLYSWPASRLTKILLRETILTHAFD
jgi:hypothetical protein